MTERLSRLHLTVANLERDLKALWSHGLWPAIERGDVPLLIWLVHRAASSHDPVALKRLTNGTTDERRQATADGIKALIEPITINLPENGAQGIPELFALNASSTGATPDKSQRQDNAGDAAGYSPSTVERRKARPWISWLATFLYEQHREYASDRADSVPAEGASVDPQSPTAETSIAPEQETTAPLSQLPEQPPESTPPCLSPKAATVDHEPQTKSRRRDTRRPGLRVAVSVLVFGVGATIVAIATNQGHSIASTHCGPTTAQLINSPDGTNPTAIVVYAPGQEGNMHGWINPTPDGRYNPKVEEVYHYNEVRHFALQYGNFGEPAQAVAKLGNTDGATLSPNSTCVYRHGKYSSGTRYQGRQLTTSAGLPLGKVATFESVYVTFNMLLPALPPHDSPEEHIEGGAGAAGTKHINELSSLILKLSP